MMKEAENDKGDNATSSLKSSVFDKLQLSMPQQCPSAFSRMGKNKTPESSMFYRLSGDKQSKPSVFVTIKAGGKSLSSSLA